VRRIPTSFIGRAVAGAFALTWFLAAGARQASDAGQDAGERVVSVFAAASLSDAFLELGRRFEARHPGTAVRLNFAGSQQLATQIEHGASADVFASADQRWMEYLGERSLVSGGTTVFARNRLVVIIPRTNPARIGRLQDLARRGVKVILAAEAVPAGKYSRQMLHNLSRTVGFAADFARRVQSNVVSEEENVRSVVGKIQLGEADAGVVYRSDVSPSAARHVRALAIPDSANVLATYPIARVRDAKEPGAAGEFIGLVLSPEGQRVLEQNGLIPVLPTGP
jgi:molybdate transport system substrate-binding protein